MEELAQHFMGGRGEKTQAQGGEALAGDRQEGGGGLMGAAQSFLGQHMGGETGTTGSQEGASHQTGGGGLAGMAQQFLGGHSGAEGEGAKRGGASGLMGAAAAFMGGGSSEGGAVGASTAEGAGKMDVGIVDKLLSMYSMTHGKKFEGGEGEYDQLAGMAQKVLGTPIGKDLLKSWVRQRMGI